MPPKGKQGTKGQKQIEAENKQTLQFYLNIILGVNVVYFAAQLLLFSESFTTYYIVLSLLAVGVQMAAYKFMHTMSTSGTDINMEAGMGEHAKDVLLLTAIVEGLSIISNYFWLIWLVINPVSSTAVYIVFQAPARALYMLWVNILGPWFFAEAPPEIEDKKKKKMERKMRRH